MRSRAFETNHGFAQTFAIINIIRVITQVLLGLIRKAFLARRFISDTSSALKKSEVIFKSHEKRLRNHLVESGLTTLTNGIKTILIKTTR